MSRAPWNNILQPAAGTASWPFVTASVAAGLRRMHDMEKKKIYVYEMLQGSDSNDVALVKMDGNKCQLCLPKNTEISKYVGKEAYYEFDGKTARFSDVYMDRGFKTQKTYGEGE